MFTTVVFGVMSTLVRPRRQVVVAEPRVGLRRRRAEQRAEVGFAAILTSRVLGAATSLVMGAPSGVAAGALAGTPVPTCRRRPRRCRRPPPPRPPPTASTPAPWRTRVLRRATRAMRRRRRHATAARVASRPPAARRAARIRCGGVGGARAGGGACPAQPRPAVVPTLSPTNATMARPAAACGALIAGARGAWLASGGDGRPTCRGLGAVFGPCSPSTKARPTARRRASRRGRGAIGGSTPS